MRSWSGIGSEASVGKESTMVGRLLFSRRFYSGGPGRMRPAPLVTAIVLRWPVAAEGKAILGRQSLKDLPEEDHGPPPSNHRNRRPPAHHPRRELRRHARHRDRP